MTEPDPKRFAKTVAKQLDRRRMRRRLVVWLVALAAALALLLYLRCGAGLGTGGKVGKGGGSGTAAARTPDAAPARCALRLAAAGLTVDGAPATVADAIAACQRTTGADVLITGDARQGDWDELRAALEAAGIAVFAREPRGVQPPDAGPPDGAP